MGKVILSVMKMFYEATLLKQDKAHRKLRYGLME